MKIVVIYKSRTGYTKKYAQWIAEDLKAHLYESSQISTKKMLDYDTIIYGGGLYAAGINGLKRITKKYQLFADKNIVVFATGATPNRKEEIDKVKAANIQGKLQDKIPMFYLRGGFDFSKLGLFYKIAMSLFKASLKNKKDKTPDEKGMLAAYDKPADFTKKERIEPLIEYVKSL